MAYIFGIVYMIGMVIIFHICDIYGIYIINMIGMILLEFMVDTVYMKYMYFLNIYEL